MSFIRLFLYACSPRLEQRDLDAAATLASEETECARVELSGARRRKAPPWVMRERQRRLDRSYEREQAAAREAVKAQFGLREWPR